MPNEVPDYGVNAPVAQGDTLHAGQSGIWPIVPSEAAPAVEVAPEPAQPVSILKES